MHESVRGIPAQGQVEPLSLCYKITLIARLTPRKVPPLPPPSRDGGLFEAYNHSRLHA